MYLIKNYNFVKNYKTITMTTEKKIDAAKLEEAANRLRVMAHPVRIAIIEMLEKNKQMNVTQIYEKLNLEQAAASNHLTLMKTYGILESRRAGKNTIYSVKTQALSKILECIKKCG